MLTAFPQSVLRNVAQIPERASALFDQRWLIWAILAVGILLRVSEFVEARSLWFDEAMLSQNILSRSFEGLTQPLGYNQAAPIGVLLLMKASTLLFGKGELALRLLPMLAGIATLFLFYKAAQQYNRPSAVIYGVLLVAVNYSLVYHGAEVKPYSSDATVALLLYIVAAYVLANPREMKRYVLLQLTGALALWFSFPALFALAGIGLTLAVATLLNGEGIEGSKRSASYWLAVLKKNLHVVPKLLLVFATWGVSFVMLYLMSLRYTADNQYLVTFWAKQFMPFPFWKDIRWFIDNFFAIFNNEWAISLTDVSALMAVIGCVALYQRSRTKFFLLLMPAVFTLIASAFYKYPFGNRLITFMIPLMLILIAEGIGIVVDKTYRRFASISVLAVGIILVLPGISAVRPLALEQNIKPVMAYVERNRQPNDVIYVYYFTKYAFAYYSDRYGFDQNDWIAGRSWVNNRWDELPGFDRINFNVDLNQLRGNDRVWVFFSNSSIDENTYFIYLNSIGTRLDEFHAGTASAYLYDLNKQNDP